jgi:hypothetical protein
MRFTFFPRFFGSLSSAGLVFGGCEAGLARGLALMIGMLGLCWAGAVGTVHGAEGAPVTLAWDANPETDLAGYRVYYGLTSGTPTKTLDVGKATTAILQGLTATTTYYAVITAYNTAGVESFPSDEISFNPLAPPPVTFTMEPLTAPAPGDPALTGSSATITGWAARPDGGFGFVITAAAGQSLAVYASDDMLNWELLGTTSNPTGRVQAVDQSEPAQTGRYYQVLPHQG